jgi:transcriptional regulator with XRE-family HTH domain
MCIKDVINFELGEILKLFRERANLTKTATAKIIGLTPATITNYETGRTELTYKKMMRFRKAYGEEFDRAMKAIDNGNGTFIARVVWDADDMDVEEAKLYPRLYTVKRLLAELDE